MAEHRLRVRGGGDSHEVAAVVAAVVRVLAEEEAKAVRPPPPRQHPWVLVGRMRQAPPAPRYDTPNRSAVGWGLGASGTSPASD